MFLAVASHSLARARFRLLQVGLTLAGCAAAGAVLALLILVLPYR